MSLFQKSVLNKSLKLQDKEKIVAAFEKLKIYQSKAEKISEYKEEEYQDGFLRDVFVDVLGYTYKYDGADTFNLLRERKNISDSKHYFTSANFVNSIFTRKVQVLKDKKKVAEIKGYIKEVEVFPKNTVEWWFIPLKTGTFKDLFCKVFDKKTKKTHKEMGMVGTIIIEQLT